jgi:hypothetical protein
MDMFLALSIDHIWTALSKKEAFNKTMPLMDGSFLLTQGAAQN